ncbi:MAG: hypothetical protein U0324_29280 [Polyangiales bacterium]
MPVLPFHLRGDGCWPDLADADGRLAEGRVIHLAGTGLELARLPAGMSSGASSVTLRVDLPDGRVVLVETSLAALRLAVQAFVAADEADAAAARPAGGEPS